MFHICHEQRYVNDFKEFLIQLWFPDSHLRISAICHKKSFWWGKIWNVYIFTYSKWLGHNVAAFISNLHPVSRNTPWTMVGPVSRMLAVKKKNICRQLLLGYPLSPQCWGKRNRQKNKVCVNNGQLQLQTPQHVVHTIRMDQFKHMICLWRTIG